MIFSRQHSVLTGPRYDHSAYIRSMAANPSGFVSMASIVAAYEACKAIRTAPTIEALNQAYRTAARAAKGDTELLESLKAYGKQRKTELQEVGA